MASDSPASNPQAKCNAIVSNQSKSFTQFINRTLLDLLMLQLDANSFIEMTPENELHVKMGSNKIREPINFKKFKIMAKNFASQYDVRSNLSRKQKERYTLFKIAHVQFILGCPFP